MTRDEIRMMAEFINTHRPAWMHITVPDPEPAYWDNFPHLLPEDITRYSHGNWAGILKGNYEPIPCDACGQLAWERTWILEADVTDVDGTTLVTDSLYFCLPCLKAALELPQVFLRESYELELMWDMREIVPSQGVFSSAYWRRKAQENLEDIERRFPPKDKVMAASNEDVVLDVLSKTNIVDVVKEYVDLQPNNRGKCPFHAYDTDSFAVSEEKGVFYCYACHESGDVLWFLIKKERMTFPEAVKYLQERLEK
jgi:CHC2 zinc finger